MPLGQVPFPLWALVSLLAKVEIHSVTASFIKALLFGQPALELTLICWRSPAFGGVVLVGSYSPLLPLVYRSSTTISCSLVNSLDLNKLLGTMNFKAKGRRGPGDTTSLHSFCSILKSPWLVHSKRDISFFHYYLISFVYWILYEMQNIQNQWTMVLVLEMPIILQSQILKMNQTDLRVSKSVSVFFSECSRQCLAKTGLIIFINSNATQCPMGREFSLMS